MTDPKLLPLDDQICFSLYKANIAVNRTYKPMLDALGLTYPQYLVLNVLGETDGRTIGMIAARLALDSSTITPLVKRMEQAGLLIRQRGTLDDRQVQARLTESGRALLVKSCRLNATLLERSGMTIAQLDALNRQLQTLGAALGPPAIPQGDAG